MTEEEQRRLVDALAFAAQVHAEQTRKRKPTPYISHPLQVAGLVLEYGGDIDEAIAGLLHDTIEDAEHVTEELLRERFGPRIANIVQGCTDTFPGDTPGKKSPWKERKTRYLEHLPHADASTLLVSACDKLHNLSDIVADLRVEGVETLDRFIGGRSGTLWYYEELCKALGADLPESLLRRIDELLEVLREYVRKDGG